MGIKERINGQWHLLVIVSLRVFEGEKVLELLIKALDNTQVILLLTIIITTFLS